MTSNLQPRAMASSVVEPQWLAKILDEDLERDVRVAKVTTPVAMRVMAADVTSRFALKNVVKCWKWDGEVVYCSIFSPKPSSTDSWESRACWSSSEVPERDMVKLSVGS